MKYWLVLLAVVTSAQAVQYNRYHVYRVGPLKSEAEVKLMKGLIDQDERLRKVILFEDDVSHVIPMTVAVAPVVVHHFLETLSKHSISFKLLDRDLQRTFDKTMEENQRALKEDEKSRKPFSHKAYLRYYKQVAYLEDLAESSSIARTFSIGNSYEKRPLVGLSINDASPHLPSIYIDANTHAREWITSATLLYIANKILNGSDPDAIYLRTKFRWYLLPNTNPDGYEYTWTWDRMWRKTRSKNGHSHCRGADPNRNWDSNWSGEGTSSDVCSEIYHGPKPFSEPETKAASDFLRKIRDSTNVMITIHSYSELWLVPWGAYRDKPSDYDELMRVANASVKAIYSVNQKRFEAGTPPDLLYVASGGSFDWAKESNDIQYAYGPELRPGGESHEGFDIPPSNIIPSGEEIFAAIVACVREARHKL